MRIVAETGKPIAQVAQVAQALVRLRRENARLKKDSKELAMERDVLERCMVLWVK
ncbi:hypothetical protein [Streptomyces broussonetiae]|uniref:hypothetical protein n=1 Tax=Streptomyces broussonetiae TaxID=2686304 RepID=UPI001E5F0BCE|nr:hypothetical protein [Streptomyces broussonetiae]